MSAAAPPLPDARAPGERLAAAAVFTLLVALRVVYAGRLRVDTDELQHLHVAWGWSRGLVQYRDVFDNHMPLFHLLMAPVVRAAGETPDIVPIARLALFPCFVGTAWAAACVGRRTCSPRAAAWGTLLGVATFEFYLPSLEVRADDVWALAWVAGLAVAVGGPFGRGRALATGACFGVAALASVKTALLLLAFAGGAVGLALVAPTVRAAWPLRRALVAAGWMALPGLLLAAALAAWMASLGALDDLVACVFVHSYVPGGHEAGRAVVGVAVLVVGVVGLLAGGRAIVARSGPDVGPPRALLLLSTGLYVLVLETVWIAGARQDKLPVVPVLGVLAAGGLEALVRRLRAAAHDAPPRLAAITTVVLASVVGAAVARTVWVRRPWQDETQVVRAYLRDVLRLTDPDDTVLDPKGQSVFRRRATYLVFERFTRERLARGLLTDRAVDDLVAQGTWLAAPGTKKYGPATDAFLLAHTVRVATFRVAGALVTAFDARGSATVAIGVPATYAVVREDGAAFRGAVDGVPYAGPLGLAVGPHVVDLGPGPATRLAVVPARVVERGYAPFVVSPLDVTFTGW